MLLPDKWGPKLTRQPETGMGYQVATVVLKDGTRWNQVLIESGVITRIRGQAKIPFKVDDIADILVTHDKWNFAAERGGAEATPPLD